MIKNAMIIFLFLYGTTTFAQNGNEAYTEYSKVDKELNLIYNRLKTKLRAIDKVALVKSQKAWINYIKADCAFMGQESSGGVIADKRTNACKIDMMRQRTIQLKDILKKGL